MVALVAFVAGAGFFLIGVFGAQNDRSDTEAFAPIEWVPSPSPAQSTQDTPSPTPAARPTATPYAGAVARLKIPRFGVDSAIENLGLIPGRNELDIPKNPLHTGWYEIYDRPGFGGNALFSAHVDYFPDIKGPFFNLYQLEADDEVVVVMDNGLDYRYRVIRKQRYDVATIPMGELIWPPSKAASVEWITLITCGGRFRAYLGGNGSGEYLDRDVVVAERVR